LLIEICAAICHGKADAYLCFRRLVEQQHMPTSLLLPVVGEVNADEGLLPLAPKKLGVVAERISGYYLAYGY
jgi:hypothetical protein